ncbi:hypothetical protein [Metabacillus sp. RGM 3146]|uniref:hypothetical protein n=1 Tax=Metabacillus sp. RGM 3146 TaxID=3401092 RepID=UPI003B997B3B
MFKQTTTAIGSILLLSSLAACSGQSTAGSSQNQAPAQSQTNQNGTQPSAEKPVAQEKNPLGDISDSQAFVDFTSQKNTYSLVVPEGWARSANANNVQFVSKLDGVKISEEIPFASTLTVDDVKTNWIPKLQSNERAVNVDSITKVHLPVGDAVRIVYSSNSEQNTVTGKQVRLENNAYLYQKNNTLVILSLWAPLGSDNVDQWRKMSTSFRWK